MQSMIEQNDLILMEAAIVEPIRRDGIVELDPILVHGNLIYDPAGRDELRRLYLQYASVAYNGNLPFLMCTPTWRTNLERVQQSGADQNINRHAVEFLRKIRDDLNNAVVKIGGTIGCKNDCYQPNESLSADEAEKFHAWQVDQLAKAGVDFLFGVTLPAVDEALGIARAMASTDIPYFVSFVINREGSLLDGTPLADAIEQIDNSISRTPHGYMINCAYPTFLCADQQPKSLFTRLIGFQGNASSLDHSQLDGSDELQVNELVEWGDEMISLHDRYGIKILGGCCGTNSDHLRYIADRLTANRATTEPNVGTVVHPATCPEDCMYRRMVFWLLVTAQIIIAATMVLLLKSAFDQIGTTVLAILGISFGVWAIVAMGRKTVNISPALRSTARFVVHGPYRFVRHPMYTALLTFCGAYAISEFSWLGLQLWIGLAAIIAIKIAYEEPMLKRRFPEYDEYARRVKRLIPWVF